MGKITKGEAKKRIETLINELNTHNKNYYLLNSPIISDFEYDILMQELISLEIKFPEFVSPASPSQKIGSDLEDISNNIHGFKQIPHKYPMLSLGNTYNQDELFDFNTRIAKVISSPYSFSCELKFDGTAICLTYKNGVLDKALTRGDGTKGDDVTRNVKTISSIPTRLSGTDFPAEFEIRGEIYLPYEAFDRLNKEREEEEEQPFANPRNAAAGSLKILDSSLVQTRSLNCVLYHVLGENLHFKTHAEAIDNAKKWGLPVSEHSKICHSIEEAIDYINFWDIQRKFLPFATDGIVIKVNELNYQKQLGFTAKSPRWATAFKFKPEQELTKLLSVDYQVGRTGAITPVANLEPVQLSGTVVKRASLHNKEQMNLLDIRIGDYVYVEKGGEIIPKITGIEISKRNSDVKIPDFPQNCPDCGTPLIKDESQAKYYCPNSDFCPTQIKSKFIHFISRKAMDILAGDATIEQLFNKGYINSLSDLYKINKDQLLTLDGWKEKSADNFIKSIENSKSVPFHRVLYAIGIRHIGETTAKMLSNYFKSIDALSSATRDDLLQIDEIGDIVADSIIQYFKEPIHIRLIEDLKSFGLNFEVDKSSIKILSEKLSGKSIVISGNFTISREDLKHKIELHGGKNTGSISGNTSYLVVGEKYGPEKMRKAEKLGIKIIDEKEFYKIIGE